MSSWIDYTGLEKGLRDMAAAHTEASARGAEILTALPLAQDGIGSARAVLPDFTAVNTEAAAVLKLARRDPIFGLVRRAAVRKALLRLEVFVRGTVARISRRQGRDG